MINAVNVISDTNIGGAGKCVLTFLKHHSPEKVKLTVIIPRGSLLRDEIEKLGGSCREIDGLADKSLDVRSIGALLRLFWELCPDIIHCHAAMSARIAGRLYGKAKIIYTRHSVFDPPAAVSRGIGKSINGFVNNITADKIIAVADAAKDNLIKTGVSPDKITVIQNGVEPLTELDDAQKRKIRSGYNLKETDFVLGIAARLTEVKGHVYILEALRRLVDDGINAKLIIAGTGEYEGAIRNAVKRLGLESSVVMAGFVQDVSQIMNVVSVNVNASFGTEATSLALLEGMSLGIPAVVSDFGGNPGVITEGVNGYLFASRDSEAMYKKLKIVALEPHRLCESCKREFNARFRAEIMTEKIEALYARVLNEE